MKRVLLLGDSIRMGYCERVAELLKGRAQVQWPAENGRFALYAIASMGNWAQGAGDPESVDVVHWNCGHWDMARFGKADRPLMDIPGYKDALERVYIRIRSVFPNAKVVYALTTPVRAGVEMENPRTTEDVIRYNAAALEVMKKLNVPVNDLFAVAETLPETAYADAVHYLPEGYEVLAAAVAQTVEKYLE